MFCGYRHLKLNHEKRFLTGNVCINGVEGIWSYAKERLIKHHGVSKETESRYNNRSTAIFTQVAKYLVNLVPNLL